MKRFSNLVRVKVKGLNQERAFTKLSKSVSILKLERSDKQICEMEIQEKDFKKTKDFLLTNHFEILEVKRSGPSYQLKRLLCSYGLISALLLCCCLYFAQLSFVWQIKVYGVDKLDAGVVSSYVASQLDSRMKKNIHTEKIEIALKDNFNRISSVSAAIIGQSLVVHIYEAVLPDEMAGQFTPITSEYDCKISDIELIQGTLAVKVGDIVRKGDVLVEPYIIDSQGQKREVKAMAKIQADVWLVGSSEHSDSYYKTVRTGEKTVTSEVLLLGLNIYSYTKQCPYDNYETEESIQDLSKHNLLPFKLKKITYHEIKTELVELSFDACREQKIAEAREKTLIFLRESEIIKAENYTIKEAGGIHVVQYVITVSREIGV